MHILRYKIGYMGRYQYHIIYWTDVAEKKWIDNRGTQRHRQPESANFELIVCVASPGFIAPPLLILDTVMCRLCPLHMQICRLLPSFLESQKPDKTVNKMLGINGTADTTSLRPGLRRIRHTTHPSQPQHLLCLSIRTFWYRYCLMSSTILGSVDIWL